MSRWVETRGTALVRAPAVAGSFYPAGADRLGSLVDDMFAAAERLGGIKERAAGGAPAGLLVPHAGLVYSGVTAAAAWRQLAPAASARPPVVVMLGTNHGASWLDGVGAWTSGAWRTPLGDVPVDEALAREVVGLGPPFTVDLEAHDLEHSIEVQLPLLRVAAPGARIVPLSVSCRGPWAVEGGRRLGELIAQRRAAGDEIVLAISTDMAHYPAAAACEHVTEVLLPPILAVDAIELAEREAAVRGAGTHGLSCGMCGIEPAVLGLAALRAMGAVKAVRLASATSADAGGPADRTVGYLAVGSTPDAVGLGRGDVGPHPVAATPRRRPVARRATSMNGRSRAETSIEVRRKAASRSSSVPSTSDGSSRPQWSVLVEPGNTGHVSRARSQTVMT
jgi:AmmeMemoRadiSam system protein B